MKFRWIAFTLVGLCVIAFILQTMFPIITEEGAMYSELIFRRPWQLVTSMFLHGSFEHLFYNMFALALFGSILEKIIGSKKFISIYLIGGLVAGLGAALFYPAALGASGAIFAVLGCLTILRPKMRVFVGMIPMPMAIAAVVWAVGDLVGMFAPSGTANAAHLFGMLFGLVVGFTLRKKFGDNSKPIRIKTLSDRTMRKWESDWL